MWEYISKKNKIICSGNRGNCPHTAEFVESSTRTLFLCKKCYNRVLSTMNTTKKTKIGDTNGSK